MNKRRKTRDEREKEKQKIRRRNQIYIENKNVMKERKNLVYHVRDIEKTVKVEIILKYG